LRKRKLKGLSLKESPYVVLEIVVMIEQDYGIKIDNKELGQKALRSVASLADYLEKHGKDATG